MYNYGSPRVGNKDFADAFNEIAPQCWRIANQKDIVITVPKLLGYVHVRNLVVLNGDGRPEFCADFHDEEDVGDVDVNGVGEAEEHEDHPQHKLNFFSGLTTGSGVKDHSEDHYFTTMRGCVSFFSNYEMS